MLKTKMDPEINCGARKLLLIFRLKNTQKKAWLKEEKKSSPGHLSYKKMKKRSPFIRRRKKKAQL